MPNAARQLFSPLFRQRHLLVKAAAVLLVGAGLQLLFPMGAGVLVDGTLRQGDPSWQNINLVCAGLFCVVLLVLGLRFVEACWFQELGERATAALREQTFAHLIRLPMTWFSQQKSGDLTSRMLADLAQIQELWIFDLRLMLTYSAVLLGAGTLLLATSFTLASALLYVAVVVIGISWGFSRPLRSQATLAQEKLATAAVLVEENVRGIAAVKTCTTEAHETERFQQRLTAYLLPAIKAGRMRALFITTIVCCLLTTWVYMMWHGSWMIREGRLTPGKFTSFMFYLGLAGTAAGVVAENFAKVQRALGAHARIQEILDLPPEKLDSVPAPELTKLSGTVNFANVTFHYPTRPDTAALSAVSFNVSPGTSVALVGPSGSGKSTIAMLLCQLYQPDSGQISYDAQPAASYPLGWLRAQIAYVPQEVYLFAGTIAENIRYGKLDATNEQVKAAAQQAHALEFIDRLPEGLATLVGDRGQTLSGGQRQRLALARAILRDPAILVLDEATSALDPESEAHIQAALEEIMRERTTFIIAHRLSTVRKAQQILVLSHGTILESGTHESLTAAQGAYYHLCAQPFA
jgi:ABC-type multidrug transport system fused ATPase/permease subunit